MNRCCAEKDEQVLVGSSSATFQCATSVFAVSGIEKTAQAWHRQGTQKLEKAGMATTNTHFGPLEPLIDCNLQLIAIAKLNRTVKPVKRALCWRSGRCLVGDAFSV